MSEEKKDNLFVYGTTFSGSCAIKMPLYTRYEPQPDITAYELAQIIPYVLWKPLYKEDWEALGPAQRHLPLVEGTKVPR